MNTTLYPLFPTTDDTTLTPDGANYAAKLKRSGRPPAVVTAYLLLLLATMRQRAFLAHGPSMILRGDAVGLATALEGTYTAPFPADLWYSHPRCACSWSTSP